MKKKLSIIAMLIALLLTFTACSSMSATQISGNWHTNDIEYDPNYHEKSTYSVSYDDIDATNTVYEFKNIEGTYTMEIKAGETSTLADGTTASDLYKMTTTFTLSGSYAEKNGEKEYAFNDYSVVSEVLFHRLGNGYNLQPVKSKTSYNICVPSLNSLNTFGLTLAKYDVEIAYNAACSQAAFVKTDKSDEIAAVSEELKDVVNIDKASKVEKTISKLQKNYSFFDNNQLYFVARGMSFEENSSYTISTILGNASNKKNIVLKCSAVTTRPYTFSINDENETLRSISSSEVSISLNGGSSSGGSIKAYFAAKSKNISNDMRNLLLQFEEPYSYGLGKLVYKLKSVEYQ